MQDAAGPQTVEEIVALIKRLDSIGSQEALNLRALSSKIDNNSIENKTSQYIPSISILKKLGIEIHEKDVFKPRVTTVVNAFLYFKKLGIKFNECTELVLKFPSIAGYSIENLENKRKYLDLTQKEFGKVVLKHPSIAGTSIENLENKRKYLNLTRGEFGALVLKFPQISGIGIENLENKRRYLDLTQKEFGALVLKFPPIAGTSIENLENKRRYLDLAQKEFGALVLKFPPIAGISIDNIETKFKFYESRLNLKRAGIVSSIINGHKKVHMSYSMYGRVMPRYVLYRRMLREKESEFGTNLFLRLLHYSDGKFISKIGNPKDQTERAINGKVEVVDLRYERAKNLCKLMRDKRSSALKSKLAA